VGLVQATHHSTQGQATGKEKHTTPTPGGQAHNRIINKAYTKHPTKQNAQWQTLLKENCAKHAKEERKQKGKGGKVYSPPTPYFTLILNKIY
jgi:hypothetical protein